MLGVKSTLRLMSRFFSGMMIMKIFYSLYICAFLITIARECIDKGVCLPYFWNILCMEISLIGRRTYKYCPILKKKTAHTMLTYCAISDIAISDIHSELGEYTITYRQCQLLIPDKKPRMSPEIILIIAYQSNADKTNKKCPSPRITCDKVDKNAQENYS